MEPGEVILFIVLGLFGLSCVIYGLVKVINAPVPLNYSWVGTTFFVFKHESNIAEMSPIEWMSPKKKNKGKKFIIPESIGKLEAGKTYELLQKKTGEGFILNQVAVMLD